MGEKEDKEKAEKLAAAKKRVAQLQKKKKAGGSTSEKAGVPSSKKEKSEDATPSTDKDEIDVLEKADDAADTKADEEDADADTAVFNEAIKSANDAAVKGDSGETEESPSPSGEPSSAIPHRPGRQPSISVQSKIRSASFRQGPGPTSPAADDEFPDIYRKQMARIEELERENKRVIQELEESRARGYRIEEELEDLREKTAEHTTSTQNEELETLRSEVDMLRRNRRQSISAPKSKPDENGDALRKEIESKESTINDMQLEISRLRSQVTSLTAGGKDENEQIAALQDNLTRLESTNTKLSTELSDVKKALSRASEKAVADGTESTSKDTKIKALEREHEQARAAQAEADQKRESLEKKIEAMNKLHRESEQRNTPKLAQLEASVKELALLKAKLASAEKDNLKLREARKSRMSGDGAEEVLDELEDDGRDKLEKQIRDLEAENFDLRRGVWRDKRREMQPNLSLDRSTDAMLSSDGFDEVDLNGSGANTRKGSTMHAPPAQTKHSGFAQVFNSGLAAFSAATGAQPPKQQAGRPRNDSLLEEFDDDAFDENAFAVAQREEEMRKMVEHVREVKKGLKQWQGWRLDLVDVRRSGGGGIGFGEIFEV